MRFIILITVFILIPVTAVAQLSAPGNSAVRYTSYPPPSGAKDPIFIFCNQTGTLQVSLEAIRPSGSGVYDFSWYGWDGVTKSFSMILKSETGVTVSSLAGLDEGGYKVDIMQGGVYDTSLVGWIVFDKPPLAEAKLVNPLKNCNYVALDGTAAATVGVFHYYDPGTGIQLNLRNDLTYMWSSNPVSVIPFPELLDPVTYVPPLEDVTYSFKVNSLGCSSEASFFYESIHVKADFTADPMQGEAPLVVTFTDKSIRATKRYTWEFGDKTPDGKKSPDWVINKDSLWLMSDPFTHTYYIPGEFSVKLTIESELGCIDSLRLNPKIVVDDSRLEIPNVFTPNGDGMNDFFTVNARSLRFISVEVYSRSGVKVYSFKGDGERLKDWHGWDGNLNNTSIKTGPGVYFYIIRALGWDNVKYDSKEYRGAVYLYR